MKKPVTIVVAALAAVLLIGGGFVIMNRDDDSASSQNTENSQTAQETAQPTEATFQSITSSGEARKCTVSYGGDSGQGNGTIYTDGAGRGRMELQFKTDENNTGQTNTLVTIDKAYTWFSSQGQTMGFIIDKSAFESNSSASTSSSPGPAPNQNFTIDCANWTVDESILSPPTDVNFTALPATP